MVPLRAVLHRNRSCVHVHSAEDTLRPPAASIRLQTFRWLRTFRCTSTPLQPASQPCVATFDCGGTYRLTILLATGVATVSGAGAVLCDDVSGGLLDVLGLPSRRYSAGLSVVQGLRRSLLCLAHIVSLLLPGHLLVCILMRGVHRHTVIMVVRLERWDRGTEQLTLTRSLLPQGMGCLRAVARLHNPGVPRRAAYATAQLQRLDTGREADLRLVPRAPDVDLPELWLVAEAACVHRLHNRDVLHDERRGVPGVLRVPFLLC